MTDPMPEPPVFDEDTDVTVDDPAEPFPTDQPPAEV